MHSTCCLSRSLILLIEKKLTKSCADLWGRGYSDTPLVPHDGRLLSLQLLFAASSSPLPWCTETFSIVGFSLGGGITMDFVSSFPHLVRSVALLAPAGMIRTLPGIYEDFKKAARDGKSESGLNEMLAGVLGVGEDEDSEDEVVANVAKMVRWQYENHRGHATSFVSTLLYGPVQGQGEVWEEACGALKAKQRARDGRERLVVVCGESDGVVRAEHVKEDLGGMMGDREYVFRTVEGGHGFLLNKEACKLVVETLEEEWKI
jgi:pimeloyl-ACP methyl ester carboxylesterase